MDEENTANRDTVSSHQEAARQHFRETPLPPARTCSGHKGENRARGREELVRTWRGGAPGRCCRKRTGTAAGEAGRRALHADSGRSQHRQVRSHPTARGSGCEGAGTPTDSTAHTARSREPPPRPSMGQTSAQHALCTRRGCPSAPKEGTRPTLQGGGPGSLQKRSTAWPHSREVTKAPARQGARLPGWSPRRQQRGRAGRRASGRAP